MAMKETSTLRFVRRLNDQPPGARMILQQEWVEDSSSFLDSYTLRKEWRDVPVEEES